MATFVMKHLGGTEALFNGQTIDLTILSRMKSLVLSRSFGPNHPGIQSAITPLIDMANHSFSCNADVVPKAPGKTEVRYHSLFTLRRGRSH